MLLFSFLEGARDALKISCIHRLRQNDARYRKIVWEAQRIQLIIFLCQLMYIVLVDPLLSWCWGAARASWFLHIYIMIVFETTIFIVIGWERIVVNRKFAKLTNTQRAFQPKAKEKAKLKRTAETIFLEDVIIAWNKVIVGIHDALLECVKLLMFSAMSRGFLVVFQWSWCWKIFAVTSLSILQSIQIFDQAFALILSSRLLSRLYDHYLWYMMGFGMWISLFLLLCPGPFHLKLIVLEYAYPWLLTLSLNASIRPDPHYLMRTTNPYGIERGIEVLAWCMRGALNIIHMCKIDSFVSTIIVWNIYYWKPILYLCALGTFASGCVRVLLFSLSFVFPQHRITVLT